MQQEIKMTREEMDEILKHMPEELKKKIFSMVKPDSGINLVKQFVEQYEDDNMLHHILAHTASNIIKKVTEVAQNISKERKEEGKKRVSTLDMAMIVIECLKHEAKNIEKALDHHEKNCDKNSDCGANN